MIEIKKNGYLLIAIAQPCGVRLFSGCDYAFVVAQAHARDGHVTFEGQRLERPRKLRWWERMGFEHRREALGWRRP